MSTIKAIGRSGQLSLGKEYAGRLAEIDQIEPGVWLVKLGEFIPDSERWLQDPTVRREVTRAVAWAEVNPPAPSDLDTLARRIEA